MKKILLVAGLLALIVAVSYIKTAREHGLRDEQYDQGFKEGVQTLDRTGKEADSLKSAMVEQQMAYTDSLVDLEKNHRSEVDSLAGVIDERDKAISTLKSGTSSTVTAKKVDPAPNKTISLNA